MNSQRSRSKSEHALQKAGRELFFKFGIRKVTVEDICSAAGVSKMTFYRSYTNKLHLAEEILMEQAQQGLAKYDRLMSGNMEFPDKVRAVIQMKHESSSEFSKIFLADLMQHQPEVLNSLLDFRTRMLEQFRSDLLKAQEDGWIRKDLSVDFIMYMVDRFNQKLIDDEFLALFETAEDAVTTLTSYFFYGILSEKGHE